MRNYTVDDEYPINLMRNLLHQNIQRDADHVSYSDPSWNISCLLVTFKTSHSSRPFEFRFIKIGHNKRLSRASGSSFATELGLPKFQNFAAQSPLVDWDTIRRWKAVCEKEHSICCRREPHKLLPFNFRLIDVESKSVIEGNTQPLSFFTLSYVWGTDSGNSKAELRRDNLAELKQYGSLCGLPRTIAHAMDVCRILGQRYLWVDRLCIVQDDKVDKYGQIRSMEAIYSRADLVIVAACGGSMEYGLPGVQGELPREQYQISTDIFGFTIANMFDQFDEATKSVWDERGWTYQEAVLARRKLYFTEAELWFECSESRERENIFSSRPYDQPSLGNHLRARGFHEAGLFVDDYDEYRQHLERYSRRILTYPSDVYNAFRGIQNSFYAESDVLFGLPESDFSRALLWYPDDTPGVQERQCNDRDMPLPSWSWASLMGGITTCAIYGNNNRNRWYGSFYCSICKWATRTAGETPERVRRTNPINDQMVWAQLDNMWSAKDSRREPEDGFHDEPDYRQFLALAWMKGCIEADVPTDLLGQETASSMSPQSLACRWPTVQDFRDEVQNSIHHKENFYDLPHLGAGHLVTHTQCATLHVKDVKYGEYPSIFKTRAGRGGGIGELLNKDEYRLRSTNNSDGAADVDFIALAVGCMPCRIAYSLGRKTLEKNCFHVDQPRTRIRFGQPGIIVMAVKWEGPIARRVALGWVALQAWVDLKPEFRRVILA